jgi:methionine synthase II (cobalamin-independent)
MLPPFATTAIGSFPYREIGPALRDLTPLTVPASPQMVSLSFWEDMFWSALDGLPALVVDPDQRQVRARSRDREGELSDFYARFLSGERDFLALAPRSRLGWDAFMDRARSDPAFGPDFLKVQILGPVTFGQMVMMDDGRKTLGDDPELLEATALALGGKAAWAAAQVRALGRTPVVFLDEPGLTAFGSAFSTLSAGKILNTMNAAGAVVRQDGPALLGAHVCGNTDWSLLLNSDLDIVNFDAFTILEQFCLYPGPIRAFLEKGGRIAWGLVPAAGFRLEMTAEFLAGRLLEAWRTLADQGVPWELLARRSLVTTACGLGILPEEAAAAAMVRVSEAAEFLRRETGIC